MRNHAKKLPDLCFGVCIVYGNDLWKEYLKRAKGASLKLAKWNVGVRKARPKCNDGCV